MIQQTIFGSYELLTVDEDGEYVVVFEGSYEECVAHSTAGELDERSRDEIND